MEREEETDESQYNEKDLPRVWQRQKQLENSFDRAVSMLHKLQQERKAEEVKTRAEAERAAQQPEKQTAGLKVVPPRPPIVAAGPEPETDPTPLTGSEPRELLTS